MALHLPREDPMGLPTAVGGGIRAIKWLHAEHEGIVHGPAVVLVGLYLCGPQRTSDLARICDLDLSTVSRHARIQETAGRLAKVAHPSDRRARRLALTGTGIEHIDVLYRSRIERFAALIAYWNADDGGAPAELVGRPTTVQAHAPAITMPTLEHVRATHQAALVEIPVTGE